MRKITLFTFALLPLFTSCQFTLRPLLPLGQHQSTPPQPVTATPAPIFKAIIPQIQNQIPKGKVVRLPSSLDLINQQGERIPVYPKIIYNDTEELRIDLLIKNSNFPGEKCNYWKKEYCAFALIIVTYNQDISSLNGYERMEKIPLAEGVVGRYYNEKKTEHFDAICWEQDGSFLLISLMTSGKQKAIDIAKSMASTLPIRSTK